MGRPVTFSANVGNQSHDIRFFVEIDGIPVRFSEAWMDLSDVLSDSVAQFEMPSIVPGSISAGFGRLDRDARRQIGGTFSFRVRDLGFAYDNSKAEDSFYALSSYIRPRARQTTTITATATEVATSISVASGSSIANGDFLYTGQETISVTSGGGGTSLTVARGNFGSPARRVYREAGATSLKGQKVFKYPQSWRGRRVRLKGAYVDSSGATTAADIATLGTWVMSGPPQYQGNDEWSFEAEDIGNLIGQFRCYVGVGDEHPRVAGGAEAEEYRPDSGYEYMLARVNIGDNVDFYQTTSTQRMDVMCWAEYGGVSVYRLAAVDTGNENIEIAIGPDTNRVFALDPSTQYVAGNVPLSSGGYPPVTLQRVKPVQYLAGPPGEIALMLMTSITGDGTNGTFDQLAGKQPDTIFDNPWQFGAGIPSGYVNQNAFLERSRYSVAPWTILLDRPIDVETILSEFCAATGSYWYINNSGEVAVAALSEFSDPTTASALTIDDSVVLRETSDATSIDESMVTPHVKFEAGFDPFVDAHMVSGTITDFDILQRYPYSHGEMGIKMSWVHPVVNGYAPTAAYRLVTASQADALSIYARVHNIQKLRGRALVSHQATCSWEASTLTAGQVVTVTNANAVDYEGGRLSGDSFLIVEKRLDLERGTVSLDLQALSDAVVWAPAFVVSAKGTPGASLTTITVSNSHASNADIADADILDHTSATAIFDTWDVSGAAWLGVTTIYNISKAARQFDVLNAYAATMAVGDIVTMPIYANNTNSALDAGYNARSDVAYQADNSGTLGSTPDPANRWA